MVAAASSRLVFFFLSLLVTLQSGCAKQHDTRRTTPDAATPAIPAATTTGTTTPATTVASELLVYVGTYTAKDSKGIYLCRFNVQSRKLTQVGCVAVTKNPSFLAVHPSGRFLYAVNEMGGDENPTVTAYRLQPKTGHLTALNKRPSGGGLPCHLVVDPTGKNVLVANYGDSNVTLFRVEDDGRLSEAAAVLKHEGSGVNEKRQEAPHPHGVTLDAANGLAFVPDLGIDQVAAYRFDPQQGTLAPLSNGPRVAPGAGPRHFSFHPNGRYGYVLNELACTITTFGFEPDSGTLTPLQTVATLPDGFSGKRSTAELEVHSSGKFIYNSNRGHDSITVFAISDTTGELTFVEHEPTRGQTPRNFTIDPTGKYLLAANQATDNIVVFRIDQETVELEATGHTVGVPSPVCVTFLSTPGPKEEGK